MADSTRGPNLGHLLKSGQFYDLMLVCSDKEFNVHKAVVFAQSKPLAAAVRQGPFHKYEMTTVEIENYDADIVEKMVQFLYTADYDHDEDTSDGAEDLVQHVQVNSIADCYGIKALADLSEEKFRLASENDRNMTNLVAATTAVLNGPPTLMHDMLAEAIARNAHYHLECDVLEDIVGEFATVIIRSLSSAESKLQSDVKKLKTKLAAARKELTLEKAARKEAEQTSAQKPANFIKLE